MAYEIWTDTSADLHPGYPGADAVRFVPMSYTLGSETRVCSSPESDELLTLFYEGQKKGDMTRTSQITPQQYVDCFSPAMREGRDVVYISLSSGLTQTYSSALMAKQILEKKYPSARLYPVDSLSATGGMGLMAERAVENLRGGMSAEENARALREDAKTICHVFMVDDLMYLKRGGRIPAATAAVGTMLNIKPILVIDREGKLITVCKKHGTKAALKEMLRRWRVTRDPSEKRVYTANALAPELSARVCEGVLADAPDASAASMMLSPIIGAHTGPGMVSLIYRGDRAAIESEN